MITKQRALFYFVGDRSFKDLIDAQKFDLKQLIPRPMLDSLQGVVNDTAIEGMKDEITDWMLQYATQIVDILTTTPTSRLKARKTHGGTKAPSRPKLKPSVVAPKPAPKVKLEKDFANP